MAGGGGGSYEMEQIEVKQRNQRNRRRERAQRISAQRESLASAKQQQRQRPDEEDSHSGEDEEPGGLGNGLSRPGGRPRENHTRPPRPPRPPRPRKKSSLAGAGANQKEPPFEEDIIDGFAILAFRTYEELEVKILNNNHYKLFIGEGTLPWAIFRFRIFSNYFAQKFEKIKTMV